MPETITLPGEDEQSRRLMFCDVTFEELRAYRGALHTEDRRMAYWAWLIHARMEQLSQCDTPFRISLLGVCTLSSSGGGLRTVLLATVSSPGLPPEPDLDLLLETTDPFEIRRIRRALLTYRRGLQHRRALATAELIERYRGDPGRCLDFVHASWTRLSLVAEADVSPAPAPEEPLDPPPKDWGRHRAPGRKDVA